MTQRTDPHADRAAIHELVLRYALFVRTGRHAELADLFTEDADYELREAHPARLDAFRMRADLHGRSAVTAYLGRAAGSGILVCPMIHNLSIEVAGPVASGTCLMTSRTWPAGNEVAGEYRDDYRREDGWRFSRRIFTMFGDLPDGAAA